MRNLTLSIITLLSLFVFAGAQPTLAGEPHHTGDHSKGSHSAMSGHDMADTMKPESAMSGMKTFEHQAEVDGIRADFQVMSLAGMNMNDPDGNTHHIMVRLSHAGSDHTIADAIGKIKVIGPDKQEQTGVLKHYGDLMAANFTFKAPGKYGVICLFAVDGQKHVVKFWYPHQE